MLTLLQLVVTIEQTGYRREGPATSPEPGSGGNRYEGSADRARLQEASHPLRTPLPGFLQRAEMNVSPGPCVES